MRLLHTADWHLGRILCGQSLLPQQTEALERLVDLAVHEKPDAVLIAGDIFDRAVPPPEAVAVLSEALERLIDTGADVVLIAGNHDGAERLDFGAGLFSRQKLHMVGVLRAPCRPVLLEDRWGPVQVWPVPYAEPAMVRHVLNDPELEGHDAASGAVLAAIRGTFAPRARQVAVCHAFVAGGDPEGKQLRPTALGGAGSVRAAHFAGFHYAALGHLHRAHHIAGSPVRYAGSLYPCSFDEAEHGSSATLVELDGAGRATTTLVPLQTVLRLRTVTGAFDDLMVARGSQDLVKVVLTDTRPVLDPMRRLRTVWPNIIDLVPPRLGNQALPTSPGPARAADPAVLFEDFWRDVFDAPLEPELAAEADAAFKQARGA